MVGAGTYCGKGGVGGVGGLRGAERDGREGRVGGERAGEGQESKEKIGRLTFSLGAAPQGGSADTQGFGATIIQAWAGRSVELTGSVNLRAADPGHGGSGTKVRDMP